jgi:hypothetical protein
VSLYLPLVSSSLNNNIQSITSKDHQLFRNTIGKFYGQFLFNPLYKVLWLLFLWLCLHYLQQHRTFKALKNLRYSFSICKIAKVGLFSIYLYPRTFLFIVKNLQFSSSRCNHNIWQISLNKCV